MRADFNIQTGTMVAEIAQEVVKAIKPHLHVGKVEDNTLYTVQSLAKRLGVSPQWIYERVHLKEIPFIKMGKFPRFRKADIDEWLDSQKVPAVNPLSNRLKLVK